MIKRQGILFALSSPSGAGKSSISRKLIEQVTDLRLSISATTRPARPGEQDGREYHFIPRRRFKSMTTDGKFLEYACVYDNYYGTLRAEVMPTLDLGKDVLLDIDWQGTQQLRENIPRQLVSIFILPPSLVELADRLRQRAADTASEQFKRMSGALYEISHFSEYDYVIINRDLSASVTSAIKIVETERLRTHRQVGLASFVQAMAK